MSERSERIIVAAPTAHGCTITSTSHVSAHETTVHQ
jgi:hypothetical protein